MRSSTGSSAPIQSSRPYSDRCCARRRTDRQSSGVPRSVICGMPQPHISSYSKYPWNVSISSTSVAARSSGPVVEKSATTRSRSLPTWPAICSENSANTSGHGLGWPSKKSGRLTTSFALPAWRTKRARSVSTFALTWVAKPCAIVNHTTSGDSAIGRCS